VHTQVDFSLKFCQFNKIVLKDITSITIATNKKPLGNAGNRYVSLSLVQ
jgi:hypothetical protein